VSVQKAYLKRTKLPSAAIPDAPLIHRPNLNRIFHEFETTVALPKYGFCFANEIIRELHLEIASQGNCTNSSHGKDQLPGSNRRNANSSAWSARQVQEITCAQGGDHPGIEKKTYLGDSGILPPGSGQPEATSLSRGIARPRIGWSTGIANIELRCGSEQTSRVRIFVS
jgi:hypothetical protein